MQKSVMKIKRGLDVLLNDELKRDTKDKRLRKIFGSGFMTQEQFSPQNIFYCLHSGSQIPRANRYFMEGGLKTFTSLIFHPFYAKCSDSMYSNLAKQRINEVCERFNLIPSKQNFLYEQENGSNTTYVTTDTPQINEISDLFIKPKAKAYCSVFILDSESFSVWLQPDEIAFRFPFDISDIDVPRANLVHAHLFSRVPSKKGFKAEKASDGIQELS